MKGNKMILDRIENIHLYKPLGEHLSVALDFIHSFDFSSVDDGKIEIDGDNIFAFVSEYQTKNVEASELEGHRKYIDVQYMLKGSELISYTPLLNQKTSVEYSKENDIIFFKGEGEFIKLSEGSFAVLFPNDLHQPCIFVDKPSLVRKVVVKVMIKNGR